MCKDLRKTRKEGGLDIFSDNQVRKTRKINDKSYSELSPEKTPPRSSESSSTNQSSLPKLVPVCNTVSKIVKTLADSSKSAMSKNDNSFIRYSVLTPTGKRYIIKNYSGKVPISKGPMIQKGPFTPYVALEKKKFAQLIPASKWPSSGEVKKRLSKFLQHGNQVEKGKEPDESNEIRTGAEVNVNQGSVTSACKSPNESGIVKRVTAPDGVQITHVKLADQSKAVQTPVQNKSLVKLTCRTDDKTVKGQGTSAMGTVSPSVQSAVPFAMCNPTSLAQINTIPNVPISGHLSAQYVEGVNLAVASYLERTKASGNAGKKIIPADTNVLRNSPISAIINNTQVTLTDHGAGSTVRQISFDNPSDKNNRVIPLAMSPPPVQPSQINTGFSPRVPSSQIPQPPQRNSAISPRLASSSQIPQVSSSQHALLTPKKEAAVKRSLPSTYRNTVKPLEPQNKVIKVL